MVSMAKDIYSDDELKELLYAVGQRVKIHRSVMFFNPKKISIASDVRIDCFCVLSAGEEGIYIGNYIHLGASTHLFGNGGQIVFGDFVGISSRVSFFTASDDYKEGFLMNPLIPNEYKKITKGPVILDRHVIIGCGSVILENVHLGLAASIGSLSLIKKSVLPFHMMAGIPAKFIGERSKDVLIHEERFLDSLRKKEGQEIFLKKTKFESES